MFLLIIIIIFRSNFNKVFYLTEISLLYVYTLVKPILDYASVLWDPHNSGELIIIARVQRKFLRYASFVFEVPYPPHYYTPISHFLNILNLTDRRPLSGSRFLTSLLTGSVDSPSYIVGICFAVPARKTRNTARHPIIFSNYILNSPSYASRQYGHIISFLR